jgi:hypothetical protein
MEVLFHSEHLALTVTTEADNLLLRTQRVCDKLQNQSQYGTVFSYGVRYLIISCVGGNAEYTNHNHFHVSPFK